MMVIGEILWEGKGKTVVTTVEDITADGAKLNYTWSAELKGCGKAAGMDGVITFTGTKIAPLAGGGSGNTNGRGIFFTAKGGDMAVIKSSGYGNPRWKKNKEPRNLELHDRFQEAKLAKHSCCHCNAGRRFSMERIQRNHQ